MQNTSKTAGFLNIGILDIYGFEFVPKTLDKSGFLRISDKNLCKICLSIKF